MAEGIQIKNLPSTTTIKQGDTMTIVQDKQNKQFSLDVFANESDLATLSPLENRCDEVKAKIEVDEYSAEITTSQSMSEIGSDDNGVNLHENVLDGAYESCVLKGKTKYIDNDTQEILDTFQDGRNLSLIDVKSPILSNVGKNLFDEQRHSNPDNFFVYSAYWSIPIRLKGNTEYRFSYTFNNVLDKQVVMRFATCKWTSTDHSSYPYSLGQVLNRNITSNLMGKTDSMSFVTPADGLVYLHYYNTELTNSPSSFNLASWYTHILKDIQLEESSTSTQCEPYKSNTTTFDQKDNKTIVLRSLPNGVCDTLNLNTGEYVQRIEEHVLDGTTNNASRDWNICWNDYSTNTLTFEGYRPTKKLINTNEAATTTIPKNFICDKVKVLGFGSMWQSGQTVDRELSITTYTGGQLIFVIEKSKLTTMDVSGFKQWLSQNPVTIQYQLENPIITKVDVQGFPHAYKNGHIQLSSGSTESSLTPTVTYKVPVSRVGQIASNTKSNLRQTIKLDQLEVLVYQSLINAEYENLLVQNSAESATSFTTLSTNDPKDELYYMLKHLIEEDQPVQNMLDKINLFYLYGLLSDEHYFDLLLGGEEDVY